MKQFSDEQVFGSRGKSEDVENNLNPTTESQ